VRPEDRAAVPPQRRARGPRTRAAGALLLPGFLAAAAHVRAALGLRRALAAIGQLHPHHLVQQVGLHRRRKKTASGSSHRSTVSFFAFTTSTSVAMRSSGPRLGPPSADDRSSLPLLDRDHSAAGPGTAPSIRTRLFSASTDTTRSPRTVVRWAPMWPGRWCPGTPATGRTTPR